MQDKLLRINKYEVSNIKNILRNFKISNCICKKEKAKKKQLLKLKIKDANQCICIV